jgi:hypothetical protein
MALIYSKWVMTLGLLALSVPVVSGQVFVVGEKSATADIATDFTPTKVELPTDKMTERGRRELVRMLEDEQGFAHRALPISAGLELRANGPLSPGPAAYKQMIYQKGQAAAPGDRVIITAMEVKADRIILDLNGGPYVKHRFLRHVQFGDNPVVANNEGSATGSRVTLIFEGPVPEISAPEVKSLLAPVIDFGVQTSEEAYADTLPPLLKDAVMTHEVLVGMTHRMVLAAMGAPENKIREQPSGDPNGATYEEWIYGHVPQTIHFVRFVGDRVTVVEIAALGKPLDIHDKNEVGDYNPPEPTREIAMGDREPGKSDGTTTPPTLRKPGETIPGPVAGGPGKVQFPTASQPVPTPTSTTAPPDDSSNSPRLL